MDARLLATALSIMFDIAERNPAPRPCMTNDFRYSPDHTPQSEALADGPTGTPEDRCYEPSGEKALPD